MAYYRVKQHDNTDGSIVTIIHTAVFLTAK